ncbi:VIT domain-containing protein [Hyalangium rubrum]|uniref:VIT domain-containing protein n=1 Tax=Hyalangium rubrum TaxID=3103134 RepID=A0ABU5HGY2_9BACT|nr:VIT domain-containing protein [Hyalangium sp. s54d21]MDY7232417.1 VIT domain-containing protein [Hyalangium sp. s54d21]
MNEPLKQPLSVEPPPEPPAPPHAVPRKEAPRRSSFATIVLSLFGVLLPAGTLIFELSFGWCASELFDPVPTPVHAILIACVPVANLLALVATHRRTPSLMRVAVFGSGMALGISLIYSFMFLPLIPLGLIGLIFYGLGLLPLSPHIAFAMALVLRRRLKRLHSPSAPMARPWLGMAVALVAFLAVEVPVTGTRLALHVAVNGTPENQRTALQWLRKLGHEETLLASGYVATRRSSFLAYALSFQDTVSLEEARDTYYRVTGRMFNSVPKPENLRPGTVMRFNQDSDQGGQTVGGRVPGLSLVHSEMKGSVDGDAALAYLEWTMSFETTAEGQSEARTQVVLPPGAVVSRVTLYIDGQEREAAFAGTAQVREAYEKVVRARRDPLLVTQRGKDRIQVQCFPVVKGPPMKIKIGITTPLVPRDEGRFATLLLPTLVERNFHIAEEFRHVVRVESQRPLTTPAGGNMEQRKDGVSEWLAALSDDVLHPPQAVLTVQRKGVPETAWTEDLLEPAAYVVRQQVRNAVAEVPERVVLVLDGSVGMKDALPEVAAALSAFPQGTELSVLAALDGVEELLPLGKVDAAVLQRVSERVRELSPAGGQDSSVVLARAWSMVASEGRTVVLWVHGPHPLGPMMHPDGLSQSESPDYWWLTARHPDEILDVMVGRGPNQVAVDLSTFAPFRTVPRIGSLEQDLKDLFSSWGHAAPTFSRERLPVAGLELPPGAAKTSSHLARLWAREEVSRLSAVIEPAARTKAIDLAARHQLVTELTGAVVLERQEQYDEAGLTPVDPGTVPGVPEPETWMLLAVACVLLIAFRLRRTA